MITALALGLSPWCVAETALASPDDGQPVRLSEVEVIEARASALTQAPTESRLETTQPQSIISLDTITNSMAPTADFATIANLAPSVSNVETNGPGLSESKHLTIRGFDDNSYNVTFDGIPFGDINDFSHHSTSYFPAKLIGQVVVERGPGTASTIGEATFGGTLALYSKDPRTDFAFIPTLSYGSWNTMLGHFEIDTGLLSSANNASAIASYQYMQTDGHRTHSEMNRSTTAKTDAYWIADLSIGYSLKFQGSFIRSAKIRLQTGNLFDKKVQVLDAISRTVSTVYNPYTDNSYNVLPGRNYFLTVSGEF